MLVVKDSGELMSGMNRRGGVCMRERDLGFVGGEYYTQLLPASFSQAHINFSLIYK